MSDSEQGRRVTYVGVEEDGYTELTRQLRRLRRLVASSRFTGDGTPEAEAVARVADALEARATEIDPAEYVEWGAGEHIMSSPTVGHRSVVAPPLEMTEWPDGRITAEMTLDMDYEGPPGCVHGGVIAMLFDEILGTANGRFGMTAMTVDLRTIYRSPTPIREPLDMVAWVEDADGRKIRTRAELKAGDRLCAEAEALFVVPKFIADQDPEHATGTVPGGGGSR